MSSRRITVAVTLAVSGALLFSVGPGEARRAQHRPDLKITSGAVALTGGQLAVSLTLKNSGTAKAKKSTISLEVDGAAVKSYAVQAVKKRKSLQVSVALPAPAPGTHTLRACADSGNKLKERKEKNNCRSVGTVTVPPTPTPPPPTTVPTDPITYPTNMVFKVGAAPGEYWMHVPMAYDDSHQTPTRLVVFLHGCGDTGQNQLVAMEQALGLDNGHYLVMAPGLGRDGACWNVDADPAKVLAAIADVKTHFNIDPKKVVIGGYNIGAALAGRVAFNQAGQFAGILAMVGRPFTSDSDRSSALAAASWKINVVLLVHQGDTTYPIATAQADQTALQNAGFPLVFNSPPGDSSYGGPDLVYVWGQISDGWTAP